MALMVGQGINLGLEELHLMGQGLLLALTDKLDAAEMLVTPGISLLNQLIPGLLQLPGELNHLAADSILLLIDPLWRECGFRFWGGKGGIWMSQRRKYGRCKHLKRER